MKGNPRLVSAFATSEFAVKGEWMPPILKKKREQTEKNRE